ncbi:MAG: UDP-3-O-(3-hydroxymyristoyl)glucosamine N-acyltransferase [Bacteroidota bacterium]|nr:UDP-3-O-(3-hydroxymyristoyl)glucosamine N-acyltransferase [Bacteroidota bacterium]
MKKYTIEDITKILKSKVKIRGNSSSKFFNNVSTILDGNNKSLVWLDSRKKDKNELVMKTKSKIIITDKNVNIENLLSEKTFIIVENPKLAFIKVSGKLFSGKFKYEIHPTAFISKEARIDKDVYIGPFTYIGKCIIKKGSIIYGNTFLYDNVSIGKNVIIHAGCVIGSDGYGYERNEINEFEKFPHFGGVKIENDVEVGANTCIDRGTLGNTIIKEGAKIDNLVHIAHNVIIGKHTAVIANSMIGGSTTIGDYSWIAPSASLMNKVKIHDNVTVGMGAVVTKDIPDGEIWTGSPARPLKEFLEMLKKLKSL